MTDQPTNVATTEPTKNEGSNDTILKLAETIKALESKIASLEDSKKNINPLDGVIDDDNKKAEEARKREHLTTFYADVKTNFTKAYGEDAKKYEEVLKNTNAVEDKINYMAKSIIKKAFGDSETTNAMLDSFKSSVVNTDSAFNAKYGAAVEKLSQDKTSINANLFNQRAGDISLSEMFKLRDDLVDFRTRNTAKTKAKSLGFIAA